MAEHRNNTRRKEDRDKENGWDQYQKLVLADLTSLKEGLEKAEEESMRRRKESKEALEKLEVKIDERLTAIEAAQNSPHVIPCALLNEVHATVTQWRGGLKILIMLLGPFAAMAATAFGWMLHEISEKLAGG